MTEYIYLHVHSDWGSTWETDRDTDRQRERKRDPYCLSVKSSLKKFLKDVGMKRNNRPSAHLPVLMSRCVGGI